MRPSPLVFLVLLEACHGTPVTAPTGHGHDTGASSDSTPDSADSDTNSPDSDTGGSESGPEPVDTSPIEDVGSACDDIVHPALAINEFLASNLSGITDSDGDTSDWIEIVNLDTVALDLAGWGLSDKLDEPLAWTFPSLVLKPGGVTLVFASGKDRSTDADGAGENHTSFSLDATDATVELSAPDGCSVDLERAGRLYGDISYGRTLKDPHSWGFFLEPTPALPNSTESRPGFTATPVFDPASGFYDGGISVSLSDATVGATLRFTTDGAEPTEASAAWSEPLPVDATEQPLVLRATAWSDGLWPSRVATATYSNDPRILSDGLDVVSLVVDPDDLWNEVTGIYVYGPADYVTSYPYFGANFWEDWERPVHVSVWEPDGTRVIDQDAGIQIHGGYTRAFNQKSFRINPRSAYGPDTLPYRFFPKEDIDEFQNIVLEGAGDWCPTMTENAFPDEIFRDPDGVRYPTVESQAWEPCVVYLNGEFWGLYAFREEQDEAYMAAHFGADPDNLDRIECTADEDDDWWELKQGTWDALEEMDSFVIDNDLADATAWDTFGDMADLGSLASAILVEGYAGNADWWYNNLRLWRQRTDDGPFHWMVFDFGHSWASYTYNHIATSVAWTGPGLPISNALQNDEFRNLLANQASDFLNTALVSDTALARLDEMHARIEPVMEEQYALWCGQPVSTWYDDVDYARQFVQERPDRLRAQVQRGLGLSGVAELTVEAEPVGSGRFRFTVVEVTPPFEGTFYLGIPITITAVPEDGWTFVGWSDSDLGSDASVSFDISRDTTLVGYFE
jgi:hypothetical protein